MAYNGSGVFSRVYSWVTDKANNVKITASRMDTEMDGFATGLSTAICKDGQTTITANLPMSTYRHTGVGNAAARTDYLAAGQAQDGSVNKCTVGGTADAITLTPSPAITAYAAGQWFTFTATATNTGATTVAISGLTTKAVQLQAAALVGGEITNTRSYGIFYDGTAFQLFNLGLTSTAAVKAAASASAGTAGVAARGDHVHAYNEEAFIVALSDETNAITTGTAKVTMRAPYALTLTKIPTASLSTASSSGNPEIDINDGGVSIFSTRLTIDANEKTSTTAATPAVLSDTAIAADAELTFDIDVAGTGAKGLKVTLFGRRNDPQT